MEKILLCLTLERLGEFERAMIILPLVATACLYGKNLNPFISFENDPHIHTREHFSLWLMQSLVCRLKF